MVSWVRMVEREGRINLKTLPMVTEYLEQGTQTMQEEGGEEALDEGYQGQDLKQEVMELRERESAYKETIREADAILSKVEGGYVQKIGAMEAELTSLRAKVSEFILINHRSCADPLPLTFFTCGTQVYTWLFLSSCLIVRLIVHTKAE